MSTDMLRRLTNCRLLLLLSVVVCRAQRMCVGVTSSAECASVVWVLKVIVVVVKMVWWRRWWVVKVASSCCLMCSSSCCRHCFRINSLRLLSLLITDEKSVVLWHLPQYSVIRAPMVWCLLWSQIGSRYVNTAKPLVYTNTMGWLGDGSHRGQGRQAWTAVGLPPQYPPLQYR